MRSFPVLTLVLLLAPASGLAAWQPGGTRIDASQDFVATESGGRIVVAWFRSVSPDRSEMRVQAWTPEGDIAPGWPTAGVVATEMSGYNSTPVICGDGAGGVYVAWSNSPTTEQGLYVQHVAATGSLSPGWSAEGIRLSPSGQSNSRPVVAHDGAGGVLVGWAEFHYNATPQNFARIHRIDADGAPATAWPVGGLSIPNAFELGLATDDAGHVFVSLAQRDPAAPNQVGFRVRRLGLDAAPDPGWPQEGALGPLVAYPIQQVLYPDGAGGVFAAWWEGVICVGSCPPSLRSTTRVRSDGTLDQSWTPPRKGYTSAPDGKGGILFGLAVDGRPGALRLDAEGAPMPGWAPGGNAAMTEVVYAHAVLVADDGEGGAFVAWQDSRSGETSVYASRLDATGQRVHGWPATGSRVGRDGASQPYLFQLVSLGGGVTIALWREWELTGPVIYLTALRPGEPGPIAKLGPVQTEVGFGVKQVRPNPASGPIVAIVELPDEGAARVDLIDASGRVLESQDFQFATHARGAVHFNQAREVRSGVYWLRVTQGSRRSTHKVVVIE